MSFYQNCPLLYWLHNYVDLRLVFTRDGVVVGVVISSVERIIW